MQRQSSYAFESTEPPVLDHTNQHWRQSVTHGEGSRVMGTADSADFQVASVVLSFLPGHISLKPEILKLLD